MMYSYKLTHVYICSDFLLNAERRPHRNKSIRTKMSAILSSKRRRYRSKQTSWSSNWFRAALFIASAKLSLKNTGIKKMFKVHNQTGRCNVSCSGGKKDGMHTSNAKIKHFVVFKDVKWTHKWGRLLHSQQPTSRYLISLSVEGQGFTQSYIKCSP